MVVVEAGRQDCSTCSNIGNCWKAGIDEDNIVVNLLVCRIQRGIDRDYSTQLFLQMIRPKLAKIALWMRESAGINVDDSIREMEGVAIESLITTYKQGELSNPLRWLFRKPEGAVERWAATRIRETRRTAAVCMSYGGTTGGMREGGDDDNHDFEYRITSLNTVATNGVITSPPPPFGITNEPVSDDRQSALFDRALRAIEDGVTFPLTEYRVLKFLLLNARDDSERTVHGLTKYLAKTFGTRNCVVNYAYSRAQRRLIEATGMAEEYFRARGLDLARTRRKKKNPKEILGAFEKRNGATAHDIAWSYGVSLNFLYRLKRKFRRNAA